MSPACNKDRLRAALDELQERFPGWRLWATPRECMVVATRVDRSAGPSATVVTNTVEELAAALRDEMDTAIRIGL